MLMPCPPAARRRAIIDIGSNSIRLVVFAADQRVPASLINEKVSARLGRNLQEDGRLPAKGIDVALAGLARFAAMIAALGVEQVTVVATAAVRDASNGPEFLELVRDLGLSPYLLSGHEEAAAAANGVLCAFPDAEGVVADLGGGSLELVEVAGGTLGRGVTLPLGTLRLAKMREKSTSRALAQMRALIENGSPRGMADGRPLYLVGGSWRALAQFAIHELEWPVRSPHGFVFELRQIAHLVRVLSQTSPAKLREAGVTAARIPTLANAALVLSALVRHLCPDRAIVSGFGLREGLAFADMPAELRRRDPLLAALEDELGPGATDTIYGAPLHRWTSHVFAGESPAQARLRLAASWLGQLARQPSRTVRRERALELALHEQWYGVTAAERACIATALLVFVGEKEMPGDLKRLCAPAPLEQAVGWGTTMRLAEKVSGGIANLLKATSLRRTTTALELSIPSDLPIYGGAAEQQHAASAAALGLDPLTRRPPKPALPVHFLRPATLA